MGNVPITGPAWADLSPHSGTALLTGDGLAGWHGQAGSFRRDGDGIEGDDRNAGDRILAGGADWTDYEFDAAIMVHAGEMAQIHYRAAEGLRCWYTLDLRFNDQAVSMGVADNRPGGGGLTQLVRVPWRLETGRAIPVRVVVRGASATGYVDHRTVGTIETVRFASGPVGFGLWCCRARFARPRAKRLA